ncbi:uncharacterized protein VP01_217g5 [Puccinia sorghi]|uniref:HCNGP-domain-containing protein n=1 Tax=Puccinia sorghi TaxID=27349 RepID=A0A0L6V9I9_9BASI|nr:uncharacterized protein VP01_217g5 [Puccinia sorghi]
MEKDQETHEQAPDAALISKITRFKGLREQGIYFNDNLVQSKSYRNPNIYAKLVEFLNISETSTNFHPSFWDPTGLPVSAQADSLRQLQQALADEKEKQRTKRTTIDFDHPRSSSSSNIPTNRTNLKRERDRDRDRERERDRDHPSRRREHSP